MEPASGKRRSAKRFFTVDEANKMLPLVRSIVRDIVAKVRERDELRERMEFLRNGRSGLMTDAHREEVEQMVAEFERMSAELQALVAELHALGVELKGPDGLVDFPAMMDDREVYLCWMLGEPEVQHWHELDAGFKGRQPIPAETMVR